MSNSSSASSQAAQVRLASYADDFYTVFHLYFFSWAFPLVMLLGSVGNASCLIVLLRDASSFPFSVRLSMMICCITDFVIVTGRAFLHYIGPYSMGSALGIKDFSRTTSHAICILFHLFTFVLLHGSPFLRLGMCFDRLVVTLAPLRRAQLLRKRNVVLFQMLLVLLALVPGVRVFSIYWRESSHRCLFWDDFTATFYRFYSLFASRLGVVTVMLVTMVIIMVTLNRNKEILHGSTSNSSRRSAASSVAAIFISTSAIFLVFELPFTVQMFLLRNGWLPIENWALRLAAYTQHLVFLNPALNWTPYLLGARFRESFIGACQRLCCYCCRKSRPRYAVESSASSVCRVKLANRSAQVVKEATEENN